MLFLALTHLSQDGIPSVSKTLRVSGYLKGFPMSFWNTLFCFEIFLLLHIFFVLLPTYWSWLYYLPTRAATSLDFTCDFVPAFIFSVYVFCHRYAPGTYFICCFITDTSHLNELFQHSPDAQGVLSLVNPNEIVSVFLSDLCCMSTIYTCLTSISFTGVSCCTLFWCCASVTLANHNQFPGSHTFSNYVGLETTQIPMGAILAAWCCCQNLWKLWCFLPYWYHFTSPVKRSLLKDKQMFKEL